MFFSCIKQANVKLPITKSLPVMYSYICPDDSLIRLKLLATSPLYSNVDESSPVSDADVKISNNEQGTANLVFNQSTKYYELKTNIYPIMPGQVYKMTVTTRNGDVATAETQVPNSAVPINSLVLESTVINGQIKDRFKVFFTDEPGRANYYRIEALQYYVSKSSVTDTIETNTSINELYGDMNHDGESVYLAGMNNYNYSQEYNIFLYYDVFLYNCSLSYYNFHKSLNNYSGNDLSAEPTRIYTNVNGGFGCFGAYMRTSLRYKLK